MVVELDTMSTVVADVGMTVWLAHEVTVLVTWGRVIVDSGIPSQEHADEYAEMPSQAEAYVGIPETGVAVVVALEVVVVVVVVAAAVEDVLVEEEAGGLAGQARTRRAW